MYRSKSHSQLQQLWRATGNSKGPQSSTQEQNRITESCREQRRAVGRKVPITLKHAHKGNFPRVSFLKIKKSINKLGP